MIGPNTFNNVKAFLVKVVNMKEGEKKPRNLIIAKDHNNWKQILVGLYHVVDIVFVTFLTDKNKTTTNVQ